MLYLVATPIGNLGDLSFRACELLKQVDYILCEDTRHSSILLKEYGISTHLKSYHRFNEAKREEELIKDLKNGKEIALITDAGTPGISDPGVRLARRCIQEHIPYSALPGPCSPILALILSGFETIPFQFLGFLKQTASQLKQALTQALLYQGTTLCFIGPSRVHKILKLIHQMDNERTLAIARELTKVHEEVLIGTAQELMQKKFLGEIILLISSAPSLDFSHLTLKDHVELLQKTYGLSKQEAIKMVAQLRHVPKKEVYF